jgi:hypothetical protein
MQHCTRCNGEYPEHWFRTKREHVRKMTGQRYVGFMRKAHICKGCERTYHDKHKRKFRPDYKARGAIRTHGKKLVDRGIISNTKELETIYGWNVKTMAHELEHTYSNGCPVCHDSFKSMGNGYSDCTLDIKDPRQKPYYGINTQWICSSCNKAKGTLTMEEFGEDQHWWKVWEENQNKRRNDPYFGLPLLEGEYTKKEQLTFRL